MFLGEMKATTVKMLHMGKINLMTAPQDLLQDVASKSPLMMPFLPL